MVVLAVASNLYPLTALGTLQSTLSNDYFHGLTDGKEKLVSLIEDNWDEVVRLTERQGGRFLDSEESE